MNARIIGSGNEAIVLAHGYGADQSFWDKITPSLAQTYRVLVFDWNFSGAVKDPNLYDSAKYSSYDAFADDLIALLDEFNLRASVFYGPLYVRYFNDDNYEGGFESSVIEQMFSNMESNFDEWASYFASLVANAKNPLSVEKYEKSLRAMRPEVALSVAKTVFHCDERDILDKVMTPCTIIQTTNDAAVPNSVAEYMQKKIKGETTVEKIDMDGHFPHLMHTSSSLMC
ncbi:Strigolactone esterase D14 [Vitis vinifera]|uniref:Strigolactone esterase D14 n=1 Tax=Vitis vinifera TaxID=29760 RepID=A0A438EIS4_VITVI|nr:Strigolactone esterase D14 [Vitis vinifera]